MIKQGEKLHDIECQYASGKVFNGSWSNNVSEGNTSISSRSMLKTT